MSKTRTFMAGIAGGLALAVATSYAANLAWTPGTVTAANEILSTRSGLRLQYQLPIDPCFSPDSCAGTLTVHAVPAAGLNQVISLESNLPAPDFVATLSSPDPGRTAAVVVRVLHPDAIAFVGPDGAAAQLCAAPPPDVTP